MNQNGSSVAFCFCHVLLHNKQWKTLQCVVEKEYMFETTMCGSTDHSLYTIN